jgi:hypothetical protein
MTEGLYILLIQLVLLIVSSVMYVKAIANEEHLVCIIYWGLVVMFSSLFINVKMFRLLFY